MNRCTLHPYGTSSFRRQAGKQASERLRYCRYAAAKAFRILRTKPGYDAGLDEKYQTHQSFLTNIFLGSSSSFFLPCVALMHPADEPHAILPLCLRAFGLPSVHAQVILTPTISCYYYHQLPHRLKPPQHPTQNPANENGHERHSREDP